MRAARFCLLIFAFAATALAVVYLRTQQTRSASRLLAMEGQRLELRSELWSLQTRAARLRSPQQIRQRVRTLNAAVQAPDEEAVLRGPAKLAVDRGE